MKDTNCDNSTNGVRIYDLWTLWSVCECEREHPFCGLGGIYSQWSAVQASCSCSSCHMECGKLFWLLACSVSPLRSPSCMFLSLERINASTSLGDPHQLVSFVTASKTTLMYILDFIHAHCGRSDYCRSLLISRRRCVLFFKPLDLYL